VADMDDVRRIAESLPEASFQTGATGQEKVMFRDKMLAWTWLERVEPGRSRVPNPTVLGLRVSGAAEKEELLASEPDVFFTEPHYDGYPAVLVRLAAVDDDELRELLTDAWCLRAPKRLHRELGL
jgi:hypothetical protein